MVSVWIQYCYSRLSCAAFAVLVAENPSSGSSGATRGWPTEAHLVHPPVVPVVEEVPQHHRTDDGTLATADV
jgi:hypothetical protein